MKLLFCPLCHDVQGLIGHKWRMCECGSSGGQYNADGMTATIGGMARVFGVGNTFFNELWGMLTDDAKKTVRKAHYGQETSDAWWGEYPGEQQIFRIASGQGPRIKVEARLLGAGKMKVFITDKRECHIDGKAGVRIVVVPAHPSVTKKKKRKKKPVQYELVKPEAKAE